MPALVRERWFVWGLRFFLAGTLAALVAFALAELPQLRVIAAIALVQGALGVLVCAWGVHSGQRRVVERRDHGAASEPLATMSLS